MILKIRKISENFQIVIRISIFVLILFFTSCDSPADSPYSQINFIAKKSLPGNGRSTAVAFSIGNYGYVALGRDSLRNPLNDCWEYDPSSDKWLKKASFPGIGRVNALAVVLNDKAYVGLGFNPNFAVYSDKSAYLKDFWMYEPQSDKWTQKADFPSDDCNACISFSFGNEIYVGLGFNGWGFGTELWKYNPDTDKWIELASFPGAPRAGSVVCANKEHVYAGTGYNTYNLNDWWEYFPSSNSWKSLKSMPDNGRVNGISLCVANRFFVFTGRQFGGNLTGGHVISDIIEYDNIRNVWYKRGNIPNSGRENAIAFEINGTAYLGFGENDKQVLNDFWSFAP